MPTAPRPARARPGALSACAGVRRCCRGTRSQTAASPWRAGSRGSAAATTASAAAAPGDPRSAAPWLGRCRLILRWSRSRPGSSAAPAPLGRWLTPLAPAGFVLHARQGFAIGVAGWSLAVARARCSARSPAGQPGLGLRRALSLRAFAAPAAQRARRGSAPSAATASSPAPWCSSRRSSALFVALPGRAHAGWPRSRPTAARCRSGALAERLFAAKIWGLGCLAGGARCGVAWNTLFLALLTAASARPCSARFALLADAAPASAAKRPLRAAHACCRSSRRRSWSASALILLFGRAGLVNQLLEWAFGVPPTRWIYGLPGRAGWRRLFAFTPIAFLILRGVVEGVSPTLEEAAQTLARRPLARPSARVTLPLMHPGLANAFLVGFIESIADFGNPHRARRQLQRALDRDLLRDRRRAVRPGPRGGARAAPARASRSAPSSPSSGLLGRGAYTTVTGKGDAGPADAAAAARAPAGLRRGACRGRRSPSSIYGWRSPAASSRPGAATTRRRCATSPRRSPSSGARAGLVWAGAAWNSLWTTLKLAAIAAPLSAALGLLTA